jgi:hypothetical protein
VTQAQNVKKPWHSCLRDIPEWGIRMRALSVNKLLKYDQPGLIDNYIQRGPPKGCAQTNGEDALWDVLRKAVGVTG